MPVEIAHRWDLDPLLTADVEYRCAFGDLDLSSVDFGFHSFFLLLECPILNPDLSKTYYYPQVGLHQHRSTAFVFTIIFTLICAETDEGKDYGKDKGECIRALIFTLVSLPQNSLTKLFRPHLWVIVSP